MRCILLPFVILLASCGSNKETSITKQTPLTKDAYFSRNCAKMLMAKQVHNNCTYSYYPLMDNNWEDEVCDRGANPSCGLHNLMLERENEGSSLKNRVTLMCSTPWGETRESEYECKYNGNGEVLYTSTWFDMDAFKRALSKN